jgi:hypothetical protein
MRVIPNPIDFKVNDLGKHVMLTVRVNITRQFKIRMAIGKFFIFLAALAMNCNYKVERE